MHKTTSRIPKFLPQGPSAYSIPSPFRLLCKSPRRTEKLHSPPILARKQCVSTGLSASGTYGTITDLNQGFKPLGTVSTVDSTAHKSRCEKISPTYNAQNFFIAAQLKRARITRRPVYPTFSSRGNGRRGKHSGLECLAPRMTVRQMVRVAVMVMVPKCKRSLARHGYHSDLHSHAAI